MNFNYYYNDVPNKGLCRNNLIYTSLISDDKKTFCQWYHNDTDYHRGMNEVVDPALMEEKWFREVKFLSIMNDNFPEHVPKILDIDHTNKKIYLEIQGPDMWELAGCVGLDYSMVLEDWDEQMLDIIQAHKNLGIYKISLHPSSYFIIDGKMKSINYFFCYTDEDEEININSVISHISFDRRKDMKSRMEKYNLTFEDKITFNQFQHIAFDTMKLNFRDDVMEQGKRIYS